MKSRHLFSAVVFGAGLAMSAVMADEHGQNRIDTQRPDAPELAAYGDLKVGVQTIHMVNPGQINILAIDPQQPKPDPLPTYYRELTVEVWYPAAADAAGETELRAFLRDGKTEIGLHGRAVRDAQPSVLGPHPLILISHGYPGNRFLMSHLAENLASKGYVVAAIDHRDSTYRDKAAFGSTLVNRPLDVAFVLNEMAALGSGDGFLAGIVDTDRAGLIGYSMGGYGAVITAGGGVTEASVAYPWGGPHGTLAIHQAGSASHAALPDPRIKTAIAIAPWGLTTGFWDPEGLKGIKIPMLFMAGSVDDVSGYEPGVRSIWQGAVGVERSLLTFDNANHNAAAPFPAPIEGREVDPDLGFAPFDHYADAVWDTARMNNIAQHFATAWMGLHLKNNSDLGAYLQVVPNANDAVWAVDDDGNPTPEHTQWKGFQERTAKGLRFETLAPDQ